MFRGSIVNLLESPLFPPPPLLNNEREDSQHECNRYTVTRNHSFPKSNFQTPESSSDILKLVSRGCWRAKNHGLSARDQEYHPVDEQKLSTLQRSGQHLHLILRTRKIHDWFLLEETKSVASQTTYPMSVREC
jgi:hypothetical protein